MVMFFSLLHGFVWALIFNAVLGPANQLNLHFGGFVIVGMISFLTFVVTQGALMFHFRDVRERSKKKVQNIWRSVIFSSDWFLIRAFLLCRHAIIGFSN